MRTPRQLKINKKEFEALIKVRNQLNGGKFVHDTLETITYGDTATWRKPRFNMSRTLVSYGRNKNDCGTCGCIGGYVGQLIGMDVESSHEYVREVQRNRLGDPLERLYFPLDEYDMDEITVKQAVTAIDNMLDTGDPRWDKVVGL